MMKSALFVVYPVGRWSLARASALAFVALALGSCQQETGASDAQAMASNSPSPQQKAPQPDPIDANRLADGQWSCSGSSGDFTLEISQHRSWADQKDITGLGKLSETASYRIIGNNPWGSNSSGEAKITLECEGGVGECVSAENYLTWRFDFAPDIPYAETKNHQTGAQALVYFSPSSGDPLICEKLKSESPLP